MDSEAAIKKLFVLADTLEKKLSRLDDLERRLNALDTNGRLDEIKAELSRVKKKMMEVAAFSEVVVNTVQSQGQTVQKLENTLTRLDLHCPLLKPDSGEFPSISERVKLKDE